MVVEMSQLKIMTIVSFQKANCQLFLEPERALSQ